MTRGVKALRPTGPEIALAVGVAVFLTVGTPFVLRGQGVEVPLDPLGWGLLVMSGLVLVLRRRAPVSVVVLTSLATLTYYANAYPGFFQPTALLVALYSAAVAGRRLVTILAGVGVCVGLAVIAFGLTGGVLERALDAPLWVGGWFCAVIVAAETARQRNAYLREVERRAADAVRTREETARRRAGEERLRIARELHDSLTHAISLVNVQAGLAVHLWDRDAGGARAAVVSIKESSKQAMRELRTTLHVLRDDERLSCAPSIEDVGELMRHSELAGVPVDLQVEGAPRDVPRAVSQAAYRIVQESLTNAVRHASPTRVSVRLSYRRNGFDIRVRDDGCPSGSPSTVGGEGIRGMRERAEELGGSLRTRVLDDGGFEVEASLPTRQPVGAEGAAP